MDANEESIGALFKIDVRFVVPRYQRQYVWSKKNWAALWNDVLDAVDRYAASGQVPRHFLGAVVLLSEGVAGPSTMVKRQVIDGQQRLATLQVLFAAVRDAAAARRANGKYLTALRKLTHNDDEMSNDKDDRFKLWPTRNDWDAFRTTMDDDRRSDAHDPHALVQAYRYFVHVVGAWLSSVPRDKLSVLLERLLTVFNHSLRLVVIDLKPGDNPQVIFESLNGRGMPLQTSDLVRNHVFLVAETHRLNADRLYEEYWARFEDGFWRQDVGKGPRGAARLDTFLAYFLTMEHKRPAPTQELFIAFRAYLAPQVQRLPDVLARLAEYGEIYRMLEQRVDLDPYEEQFVSRLDVLDTDAVMPLVLYVFGEYDGVVRQGILALIESYLIRRVIVGGDARRYASVAAGVLRRLAETNSDPISVVREQLGSYQGKSTVWPSDRDIMVNAPERSMANSEAKRIRLILSVVDQGLRTPMNEKITYDLDELTVEHLMPQSWARHWPLRGDATADERSKLVYTLGNLTLVTEPLNGELGNDPWEKKRVVLAAHSRLHLNHGLPEEWNEDSIRTRGAEFARILVRDLPGPASDASLFSASDEAHPDEPHGLVEAGPDAEDETLADELETDDAAVAVTPVSSPPSDDPRARHIYEVLGKHPHGTRLTPGQLNRSPSTEYPRRRPSGKAFAELIDSGTLSGIEITTNRHGHRAVKLSKLVGPDRRARRKP